VRRGSVEFDFDQHELGCGLREALFYRPPALVELDAVDLGVAREPTRAPSRSTIRRSGKLSARCSAVDRPV
jgi:hypothetical protein